MASVSGVSTISKVFSKLGDNSGSVIPMFAKDITSSGLTSYTYFKDGGKMDGAEKALEEFGTTVIWLGGIPLIKKIIDKTVYKKAKISPDIDPKRLFSNKKQVTNTLEFAKNKATELGAQFQEQGELLDKALKNKKLAQGLAIGKFAVSTAAIGLALYGLISFKQKRTEKKITEKIQKQYAKNAVLKNALKENEIYNSFNPKNKANGLSFKGISSVGTFFMSNPIANTAIVDGVITGTRLTQARKGEKFEVGLREACQLLFIYGLAKPLQKGMEVIGKNVFKRPVDLDYTTLNSKVLKDAIEKEKAIQGSSKLLSQSKQVLKLADESTTSSAAKGILGKIKGIFTGASSINEQGAKNITDFIFNSNNAEFAEILRTNKTVGTFTTKEGVEQISLLSNMNANKIKSTAQKTADFIENASKSGDVTKYLKQTKFLKGAFIISNILISALLMGYLQPKLNLFLRKKNNNGDNTNPAIKNLEQEVHKKLMFQGTEEK